MKRCPECLRDYTDETLKYCLDDGSVLLDGPGSSEAPTAVYASLSGGRRSSSASRFKWVIGVLVFAIAGFGAYWFLFRTASVADLSPSASQNENYLRAKVLIANENRPDVDAAIGFAEQTVKDQPQFAAGWALLARALNKKAFYYATSDERKKLNSDAEVAVERSLTIDPNLADGHFARGLILWTHAKGFPHDLAIQSYKRAIALDPNLDEAHHQLGLVYLHLGLFDKAQAEMAKALEINPGNTLARFRYGVIDLYRGKYESAYELFKSTGFELTPALQAFQTATSLFKLGRTNEAEEMVDKFLEENPNDEGGVGTSVKAMILAKKGKYAEAEAAIQRAEEIGKDFGHFHHTAYNIASAYAMMNKPDLAVRYLQMAADDGFPCYPLFDNDEVFKGMKEYPQFVTLLARLRQQWERYNAIT